MTRREIVLPDDIRGNDIIKVEVFSGVDRLGKVKACLNDVKENVLEKTEINRYGKLKVTFYKIEETSVILDGPE